MAKREWKDGFYSGVCCALAVIAGADQETYWREIVDSTGGYTALRKHSAKNGDLEIDGFLRYPRPRKPRALAAHARRGERTKEKADV